MDLFKKCYDYTRIEDLKKVELYPYFHQLTSGQDTIVQMEGKRTIMIGSNNYLGLTSHPEVIAAGVDALKKVTRACDDFGVKYLTLYAFSTENWNRKKEEVDFLMELLATTLKNELKELNENNVKMNFIGDLTALNSNLQNILKESKETTKNNTGVVLTVAINYGSRDEITNAIKNIIIIFFIS